MTWPILELVSSKICLSIFCILEYSKVNSTEKTFYQNGRVFRISIAPSVASKSGVIELIFEKFSLGKISVDFIFDLGKISVDSDLFRFCKILNNLIIQFFDILSFSFFQIGVDLWNFW